MRKLLLIISLLSLLSLGPLSVLGQELYQEEQGIFRAVVRDVLKSEKRLVPGTETSHIYQVLEVEILEGARRGETLEIENDFIELESGDKFFLYHARDVSGLELYSVRDIDRRGTILWLTTVFVLAALVLGGKQGFKALLSLAGSFFVILYVLVPGLLAGFPPILTATLIASAILAIAIYVTHGWNGESHTAFAGTVAGVAVTGVIAHLGVSGASLSGFASDEAVYLNFNTPGLDFAGLLLGGIIIGALGVLDDIAVTQSAVVSELYGGAPNITRREVYSRAMRVGREHVGALINTLALAYTGASLPLLLLFSTSTSSMASIINQEVFASEIVRIIAGSMGLILTVPLTTLLATIFLEKRRGQPSDHSHSHSHSHHGH